MFAVPTSPNADKNRIVVTAHNIELIKQALAKKKLVGTKLIDPNGKITLVSSAKLVSPQSLSSAKPGAGPLTVQVKRPPYPVNLISVQPSDGKTPANPANPPASQNVTSSKPQKLPPMRRLSIVNPRSLNEMPASPPPKVANAALKTKPGFTLVPGGHVKLDPTKKKLAHILPKATSAQSAANTLNNMARDRKRNMAKHQIDDLCINIEQDLDGANINQVQSQLNNISRVVIALRQQLGKQQAEIKSLRDQNARISEQHYKLTDLFNIIVQKGQVKKSDLDQIKFLPFKMVAKPSAAPAKATDVSDQSAKI